MRLFLALELDERTRHELATEIAFLRSHAPKVKWVRPENLHVTVKFLGAVEENEITPLAEALAEAAAQCPAFTLAVRDLGVFPDPRRPRVVWAGAGLGSDEAARLAAALEAGLLPLGFDPERRRYTPHVTLGRVKHPGHARNLDPHLTDAETIRFGEVDVEAVTLFLSELGKRGASYTPIYRAGLAP